MSFTLCIKESTPLEHINSQGIFFQDKRYEWGDVHVEREREIGWGRGGGRMRYTKACGGKVYLDGYHCL